MRRKQAIPRLVGALALYLLISGGCAPVVGTGKLVYRSAPRRPHWLQVVPQSRTYEYFIGISDNRNSLDEAKKAALSDALNDALTKRGVEVSSRYEKLTSRERAILKDQLSVTGVAQLGLEQVALYYEIWDYYEANRVQKKYRAFILTRSRKLKPGGLFTAVFAVTKQRFDAFWHSMLLPGWGQYRYGRTGKGNYFLFSEMALVAGMGYSEYLYRKQQSDIRALESTLSGFSDPSSAASVGEELQQKRNDLEEIRKVRRGIRWAAGIMYGLNLVDALLFGPPSDFEFAKADRTGFHVSLAPSPEGLWVTLQYSWPHPGRTAR